MRWRCSKSQNVRKIYDHAGPVKGWPGEKYCMEGFDQESGGSEKELKGKGWDTGIPGEMMCIKI